MRLIKVYSNKESFHTVEFSQYGLNFIIAKQKNPGINDDGKTYNGVGKSLLVRIINFCLGAKKNYKGFCEKLFDWEFYMDFLINDRNYTVKRSTNEPQKVILNNEEFGIEKYILKMQELCFSIPEGTNYLSFRSLIPFFIRPSKESYVDCMKPGNIQMEYQKLLINAFLLGLDIKLAEKKFNLRKEQDAIKNLEKGFSDSQLIHEYFSGSKDISLELTEINDQIRKIENNMAAFQVAEDYYDIQQEADKLNSLLFSLNNEIVILENNIMNIQNSLIKKPTTSITVKELERIYNESNIYFPANVKKTLHDIEIFYKNLMTNRIRRLTEQKNEFTLLLNETKEKFNKKQKIFDEKIKYLGEHQALDVFLALNQECSELKSKRDNLYKFQELQSEIKQKKRKTKKELIEFSELTENYLLEIKETTEEIKEYFRYLAKLFYPKSTAGLTVKTNSGENQLAFEIEPRIESDASDGINNVKIFCYDLALLFKGKNHKIGFIFHDSRLFDGIDERQKSVIFTILKDEFKNTKKQYIATINQNQLNEIKSTMDTDDFEEIINNNTVLTLTDDDDTEKLLGIKVDIGNT